MDADKERLAFYHLVNQSCRAKLPQYFLITPKLLTGLRYNRDITVLFIMNGAHCIEQKKWNIPKFLDRQRSNLGKRVAGGGAGAAAAADKRRRTGYSPL